MTGFYSLSYKEAFASKLLVVVAVLVGFSVPVSTALLNIGFLFILISCALNFDLARFSIFVRDPIVLISLSIFSWIFVSQLWFDNPQGWAEVSKSRKLIFILPVVLFFVFFTGSVKWVFKGFLFASIFILLLSTFVWLSRAPVFGIDPNNAVIFKNHITQNFLMAFFAYCSAEFAYHGRGRLRILWGGAFVLAVLNILFMVQGRIGYLSLATGFVVFVVMNFKPKWWIGFFASAMAVVALLLFTDNIVADRIQLGVGEMVRCAELNSGNIGYCAGTSMGLRLYMYHEAFRIFLESPVLGSGAGSVAIPAVGFFSEIHNPHNEFLMILVQQGVVGFSLWIVWFSLIFKRTTRVSNSVERSIFVAGLLMFLVGCAFNSLFRDMTEGHAFVLLVAAIIASSVASTGQRSA